MFKKYLKVSAFISQKRDGNMKPVGEEAVDKQIFQNQDSYIKKLGLFRDKVIMLNQAHGDTVLNIEDHHGGKTISDTDALISNKLDLALSIRVADCVPIFLFDYKNNVIGLVHGGWRGLSKNIIRKTITKAKQELGLNPSSTHAAIGPAICQKHYEVGGEVADKFDRKFIQIEANKEFLDLKMIAKDELISSGINIKNIEVSKVCTYEEEKYFSYRRDRPRTSECMMVVFGFN